MTVPAQESSVVALRPTKTFDLSPQTFEQALTFSQMLADSDLVPKDYRQKPGNCMVAMQWGAELGLKPLQAIQNIAVINGRPSLWGDSMLGLVRASPLCEYVVEDWLPDGTAICRAKRRGEPEQNRTFSDADARLAGLLGKQGPWTTGPKRMKQLRARAFALRDVFTDVLRGMDMAEALMDYPTAEPKHMGDVVQASVALPAEPPAWPAELFAAQFERWTKAVGAGLKSVDDIVALARSKGALSAEQEARIRAIKPPPEKAAEPAAGPTFGDATPAQE